MYPKLIDLFNVKNYQAVIDRPQNVTVFLGD